MRFFLDAISSRVLLMRCTRDLEWSDAAELLAALQTANSHRYETFVVDARAWNLQRLVIDDVERARLSLMKALPSLSTKWRRCIVLVQAHSPLAYLLSGATALPNALRFTLTVTSDSDEAVQTLAASATEAASLQTRLSVELLESVARAKQGSLGETARALSLSARTLQRRLKKSGRRFRDL